MASLKYALKLERVVRRTNSLFVPFTCKRTLSTNVCCAKCQSEMVSDSKCKRSRNESQNFWTNRAFSTKPGVSENIVETLSQPAVQHSEEHPGGIQTNDSDEVIEVPEDLTEAAFIEVTGDAKIEKYAKLVSSVWIENQPGLRDPEIRSREGQQLCFGYNFCLYVIPWHFPMNPLLTMHSFARSLSCYEKANVTDRIGTQPILFVTIDKMLKACYRPRT